MPTLLTPVSDDIKYMTLTLLHETRQTGFEHSAWALRGEAHLDNSPNTHIPIPRGEIVMLFRKALLYMEAERAFKVSDLM